MYFCRNEDIGSAAEYPEVVYIRLIPFQSLMGSLPVKAMYRGPIVNMSGVIKGKFPSRLREASLKSHGFSLCQEIGLVAFMFFFELLCPYVSLAISFYVSFTNLFSIILFLIC